VSARQTIVVSSFFLILALFSFAARDAALAEERWPPWQSYSEAEEAARQKALKRKKGGAQDGASLKRQVAQLEVAGKFAQAEPLARRYLARVDGKGASGIVVADALDSLARILMAQDKPADAEPLLKRSVALREKAPGQPGLAAARDQLAALYDKLGKTAEAEGMRSAEGAQPAAPAAPAEPEKEAATQAEEKPAAEVEAPEAKVEKPAATAETPAVEEPFSIPSADVPSAGAPPVEAGAQPDTEAPPAVANEEPFSIPSADAPAGGSAPPAAEVEETPKSAEGEASGHPDALAVRPKYSARRMMPRPAAPAARPEPGAADSATEPPAAAAPSAPAVQAEDPEDSRNNRPDIIAEPMPQAGESAPQAEEPPVAAAPPPAASPAPAPDAEAPLPSEGGSGATYQRRGYYNGPAAAPPPPNDNDGMGAPAPAPQVAEPAVPDGRAAVPDPVGGAAPPLNPDYQVVPVYWGTDRAVQPNAQRLAFGSDRARKLQLGMAQITVPKVHEVPNVERPWVVKIPYFDVTLYAEKEDAKKHFTVKDIKALTKEELLAQVRERLKASSIFKDQALVFVHGYNTSFDNALYRTAQIAYDLDFDGAPFVYSWPSGGAVASYTYDRESAQASEPYLRQFLEMVTKETGAKKVSIIAHSMGNQPVMDVLRDMRNAAPEGVEISQVILAAPDVDADNFANLANAIKGLAKNVTLYVASNDRALIVSRNFWGSYRAGDVPPAGPLILPGVDTIDVTAASTDAFAINHSGYAANNKLLTDIAELLRTGLRPPEMRTLKPGKITTGAGDYWRYVPAPQ